jgi:hypothetical protein
MAASVCRSRSPRLSHEGGGRAGGETCGPLAALVGPAGPPVAPSRATPDKASSGQLVQGHVLAFFLYSELGVFDHDTCRKR